MRYDGNLPQYNEGESVYETLLQKAKEASGHAYAPYSKFQVGAALLAKSGKIYMGANVENSSFGVTVCAERMAFLTAIYAGERDFKAIAVSSPQKQELVPCGICLQTMQEFCTGDFVIAGETKKYLLKELLPRGFQL